MDIFQSARAKNGTRNNVSDQFKSNDTITLGKTSTKRATNMSALKNSKALDKIFERNIISDNSG